jgi:hypothetical protein
MRSEASLQMYAIATDAGLRADAFVNLVQRAMGPPD